MVTRHKDKLICVDCMDYDGRCGVPEQYFYGDVDRPAFKGKHPSWKQQGASKWLLCEACALARGWIW